MGFLAKLLAPFRSARIRWPQIEPQGLVWHEFESKRGITDETDDVRPWNLGHHPSESFYSRAEPDFEATRRRFNRLASKFE